MRLDVDEARRDHMTLRVNDATRGSRMAMLDGNDPSAAHCNVDPVRGRPGAVDNMAVADQEIVHFTP
jgi:hypothetical protein